MKLEIANHIEHEKQLTAQIEQALKEVDEGVFASDEQIAAMRARRWGGDAPAGNRMEVANSCTDTPMHQEWS